MNLLDTLEERLTDMVHGILHDAKSAEPAIEAAVADALHESGAPAEVAAAVGALVKALRDHFASLIAGPEPEPAPAQPEPPEPDPPAVAA